MDTVQNFNGIILCGDFQRGSYGQWVLKGQIVNTGYCSLWTESTCIQHCSTVYGASSVARKLYSECYCNTP